VIRWFVNLIYGALPAEYESAYGLQESVERLRAARLPFFSVLLHPTTGGVAASFALLGDVNIAEPKALIGFAGPRVIEQTIRQKLPEGFQTSEFLLSHGMVDRIVSRLDMKKELSRLIGHLAPGR